jgi:hypothetical protein
MIADTQITEPRKRDALGTSLARQSRPYARMHNLGLVERRHVDALYQPDVKRRLVSPTPQ